jgi:hypothetical protein
MSAIGLDANYRDVLRPLRSRWGKTLTRLAALGTLSRSAGEGLKNAQA